MDLVTAMARQGDALAGLPLIEESVDLFRETNDRWGLAYALDGLVDILSWGNYSYKRVVQVLTESLTLYRELGDQLGVAQALQSLGRVTLVVNDYETAGTYFEESLTIQRSIGDKYGIAWRLKGLGFYCALPK